MMNSLITDRAWVEINLGNLEHNINELKKIISPNTKIMAVVKANAYGHGIIEISKKLNQIGINDFAVATLQEGISLRENGIVGNILILGYTGLENLNYVIKYDLIQTIVDETYAKKIMNMSFNARLKVHLKINTGMNRIGMNPNNVNFIRSIYSSDKLNVLGIFSHLCVADSDNQDDIKFSKEQICILNNLINILRESGINVGHIHLQSSYGLLNYSDEKYDYVRMGIIMYGCNSDKNSYEKIKINIKPVLSLKARVTSVKEIDKDEAVSYGRIYKAPKKEKIATVSIGYADGYPRSLSGKHARVLINGQYAEVIGRICMDQLIINVTEVSNVSLGDIVTLIGEDSEISAEEIAQKAQTITNELLCRLSNRLNYIYLSE